MSFRTDDTVLTDHFTELGIDVDIHHVKGTGDSKIRVWRSTATVPTKTTVVFLHGAPGSGDDFNDYLANSDLLQVANVMTLDRLGYGYSEYGKPEIDIKNQAQQLLNAITPVLGPGQEIVLVSHSFGGPIGAFMTLIAPGIISGHVMLCPVIDPYNEPMFFVSGSPLWWPLRYISSEAMKSAAYEKLSHAEELKKVEKEWARISVSTLHIQGGKDWLAPYANAYYVRDRFNPDYTAIRILEEESHFIPFNNKDYVVGLIMEMMDK